MTATGTAPLTYQWRKNGADIASATASSCTTPATVAADNTASFTVVVTNAGGTLTSTGATLTVNSPPGITTQPANQAVTAGQTASFSVAATGTAPLSYQWRKNGVDIAAATSASYTTPATAGADDGALFTVVVTNPDGTLTSSAATLTVNTPPSISTQPANQTASAGQTATFTVTAAGTAPLAYQWHKDGVDIASATASSYTTPATAMSDNAALFTVTVTNVAGNVTSSAATLTVNAVPPGITAQPASLAVILGQTASFSVTATGTAPLSYQWRKDGVDIAAATSASYIDPPPPWAPTTARSLRWS